MYKIERAFGKTRISMPGMTFSTDRINRHRYKELYHQAQKVTKEMELFQQLLTKALAQGK